jgi:hypothetical protein
MSRNLLDTPPSPIEEIPPGGSPPPQITPPTKEELIRGDLKVWFLLLVIICFAGLGSLSFASLLPVASITTARPSTATTPAYTDGVCTATAADIQYASGTSAAAGSSSSTLAIWAQTGKTQQDLNNVLACAASFTLKYEAYSANDLKSLEASVPMLSAAAKQRFYTPDPQSLINRMDPMWRANIQKQHLVRTVQVQQPSVVNVQTSNGRMLVWVTVPYILNIQTNGDTYPSNTVLTVLLVNAPTTATIGTMGTGWQVSDWKDNPGAFQPPKPL